MLAVVLLLFFAAGIGAGVVAVIALSARRTYQPPPDPEPWSQPEQDLDSWSQPEPWSRPEPWPEPEPEPERGWPASEDDNGDDNVDDDEHGGWGRQH